MNYSINKFILKLYKLCILNIILLCIKYIIRLENKTK